MPFTLVIADDVTGANDIGIMYTKAGHNSVVYQHDKFDQKLMEDNGVAIIDTNSRFLSYEAAYKRVYEAVMLFKKEQVHQFFDKQCSVFRGNIGAEFDAMLDALEEEFAIVVLGFPDNGRTTLKSVHYVHGTKLEDSQFKKDPVHPMRKSNLIDILQEQTKRKVSAIHYEVLDQGPKALKDQIDLLRKKVNYVIIDVRDNKDLALIAEVVKNEKIICGSSALGYYLGLLYQDKNLYHEKPNDTQDENNKILCMAGSLTPQTRSQISYMKNKDYPVIKLDTTMLLSKDEYRKEKERILAEYKKYYASNDIVLIHSMNEEEEVLRTKEAARALGINNTEISETVSNTLSELAKAIEEKYQIMKYIICGGDTSAAFCNKFQVKGMRVIREIEAGLPICTSITKPFYELVLKSGSFGTEHFIEKAMKEMIQ